MRSSPHASPSAFLTTTDVVASLAFFARLGFQVELETASRGYASSDDVTLQIETASGGSKRGRTVQVAVHDCFRHYAAFVEAGLDSDHRRGAVRQESTAHRRSAAWISPLHDEGFDLGDPDGNILRFRQVHHHSD